MDFDSIDAVFSRKQQALTDLHATVAALTPLQRAFRPAADAWSIEEIVQHLVLVESGVMRLLRLLIRKAHSSVGGTAGPTHARISLLEGFEDSSTGKVRTATTYEPTAGVPIEESLGNLRSVEIEFMGLRPRLEELDLHSASFRHDILGNLTLGQWVAFPGVHAERHLGQILRVMESPDFPKRSASR